MNALVVTTGMDTFYGRTTKLVEEAHTKSHFQGAVVKIGDYLIVLAAAMVTPRRLSVSSVSSRPSRSSSSDWS